MGKRLFLKNSRFHMAKKVIILMLLVMKASRRKQQVST